MDFYVVIPARYNSSRFPGKVLTKIGNKSMLEHVFLNAKKSNAKDVYIATDSEKIYEVAKNFTDNVYITSKNNNNGTERTAELAKILKWEESVLVINLQADMPELMADNIDFLANSSINNEGLSTLYYPLSSPDLNLDKNTVKIIIRDGVEGFCRVVSNDSDVEIYKHIGIYSYSVKDLYLYMSLPQSNNEISLSLEQYRFLDNKLKISAYRAVSDPGMSVDSLDNLNELKGVNN